MDIVIRLREARKRCGMTQLEAAESAGVGEKTISSYETGSRIGSLKIVHLQRLVAAYGLTLDEFFSSDFGRKAGDVDRTVLLRMRIAALSRETQDGLHFAFMRHVELAEQAERRGKTINAAS